MSRRVDTKGEVTDPQSRTRDVGPGIPPLIIEIPLWRLGRIRLESRSQKASLAFAALGLLLVLMLLLAIVEALPGLHPGAAALMERAGEALMLVIGVLLGVDWKTAREEDEPR